MSTILVIAVILFLGVTFFMTLAFCRSAALADRKMEAMHVRSAIDLSNAITRPTPKRAQPVAATNSAL